MEEAGGAAVGVLAEGHGWWHLLTGVGAYYYIVYGEFSAFRVLGEWGVGGGSADCGGGGGGNRYMVEALSQWGPRPV